MREPCQSPRAAYGGRPRSWSRPATSRFASLAGAARRMSTPLSSRPLSTALRLNRPTRQARRRRSWMQKSGHPCPPLPAKGGHGGRERRTVVSPLPFQYPNLPPYPHRADCRQADPDGRLPSASPTKPSGRSWSKPWANLRPSATWIPPCGGPMIRRSSAVWASPRKRYTTGSAATWTVWVFASSMSPRATTPWAARRLVSPAEGRGFKHSFLSRQSRHGQDMPRPLLDPIFEVWGESAGQVGAMPTEPTSASSARSPRTGAIKDQRRGRGAIWLRPAPA